MKRDYAKLVMLMMWFAPLMGQASDTNPPAVTQVTLKLADGGRITGTPVGATLPFQTEYAKTDIPWGVVRACECASNATRVLSLKNGDQLRGKVGVESLKLETALGKLTVPLATVIGFQTQTARSGSIMDGLVLYFPFDEDGGDVVRDASGNGNEGKVVGAQYTPAGKIGGAYEFRGQSNRRGTCIQVVNSPSLCSPCETKQLTVAVWIKPGKLASEYPSLICMGGNTPPDAYGGYELYLHSFGGEDIRFNSGEGEFFTRNHSRKWVQDHIGEWIHIAVTVDVSGCQRAIYVNGLDTQDEFDQSRHGRIYENCQHMLADLFKPVSNDLFIGKPDPAHHYNRAGFTGLMDEVMIFKRALAPEEILALCQRDGPLPTVIAGVKPATKSGTELLKIRAELVDGSVVIGELKQEELGVQSASLGKVTASLAHLRELKFTDEGKLVAAKLQNGDVLVGQPLFRELTLTTAFGRVTLSVAHLRVLQRGITKAPEPKPPAPARETPGPRHERIRVLEL